MIDAPQQGRSDTAVLAGGCFWGVQGVFQHVKGVTSAVSGYSGGAAETADYNAVGSGRTGHAEAVQITYDPSQISYGRILQIFFSVVHDPTRLDRRGRTEGRDTARRSSWRRRRRGISRQAILPSLTRPACFHSGS